LPALLLFAAAAGLGWAWWTGRLRQATFEDAAAAAAMLVGLRLATTGKPLLGVPLMAGAIAWALYKLRTRKPAAPAMPPDDARRLLGVARDASLADIRAAHRRLIARVHPDAGGSAELAERVNVARDTLVAEMNRKTPRAS
jgi:hypothetical protein